MKLSEKNLIKVINRYKKALDRIKEIPFTDKAFKELCLKEIFDLELELKQLEISE